MMIVKNIISWSFSVSFMNKYYNFIISWFDLVYHLLCYNIVSVLYQKKTQPSVHPCFSFHQWLIFLDPFNRNISKSILLQQGFTSEWRVVLDPGSASWSFYFVLAFLVLVQCSGRFEGRRMFRLLFEPSGRVLHCF